MSLSEDHTSTGAQRTATPTAEDEARLAELKKKVHDEPGERQHRFDQVTTLMRLGRLGEAEKAAREWRKVDAYNLVVVRLLGDILTEQGRPEQALRVYSAVVELLADDPDAQRALATVLKQSGQLAAARQRLETAHRLHPEDARIGFELADAVHRLGDRAAARTLLEEIANAPQTSPRIAYPAKQRLGQLLATERRLARRDGSKDLEARLDKAIDALGLKGGVDNDIKIYLTWDTNRTDVDLWVTNPKREKVFYQHREGSLGGALFDDVTDGYGPESFTAKRAHEGTYLVQVQFYGTSRRAFREARGEVVVILDEGSERERRHVVPYRLRNVKEVVTVAKIRVTRDAREVRREGGGA